MPLFTKNSGSGYSRTTYIKEYFSEFDFDSEGRDTLKRLSGVPALRYRKMSITEHGKLQRLVNEQNTAERSSSVQKSGSFSLNE